MAGGNEFNTYAYLGGTLATTTVKTGGGILKSISVTSLAVGGIIAIYDNTSAATPVIMSIGIAGLAASGGFAPYTIPLGVVFGTGLTVKTTVKAQNLVISYQ